MDCGPTCLKMVFKHYGKYVDGKELKKAAQLGKSGVSLLGMSEAAAAYGFNTVSARLSFDQLMDDAILPCIVNWDYAHFVVVTPSASKKKIEVADPAIGLVTYSREEFMKNWVAVDTPEKDKGIVLLLTPTEKFYNDVKESKDKVGWRSMLEYARQYRKQLLQLATGLMIVTLLQVVFPYLTQSVVDTGIRTRDLNFIKVILLAQFALFFGQTAIDFVRHRILLYTSTHISLNILSDFWIKLMKLPLSFFSTKRTGDILQRITDHHRLEMFITGTALQTLFSMFSLLILSIVLLGYNARIFLVFLIGSVLYLLWIRFFLAYRRELDHKRFAVSSSVSSTTVQLISGIHEIKLNNAEHLKRWSWETLQASLFRLNFRSLTLNQYQQAGAFFINQGKNILITFMVAKSVLDGELTLGAMLAIQMIIGQLNSPVEQLIIFFQQAQDAQISLERLNEVHQLDDEEPAGKTFSEKLPSNHNISFRNVTFWYPGAGNHATLKNISLEFPPGKITAIVGTSGSGKTTIIKLLQKVYDSYDGEIMIGDENLRGISSYFWRSVSGSVLPDGYLFSDTIAGNIALGEEKPDRDRLIEACRVANILGFIESLPQGFKTEVGAEGSGLSSGQKQRILIARAVYKDPAFIFFDEATNALDAENEMAIMVNLQQFFKGRTVVIVAHRLSTVKNADQILVLENGCIIESGDHATLSSKRGKYYDLVKNQLELGA